MDVCMQCACRWVCVRALPDYIHKLVPVEFLVPYYMCVFVYNTCWSLCACVCLWSGKVWNILVHFLWHTCQLHLGRKLCSFLMKAEEEAHKFAWVSGGMGWDVSWKFCMFQAQFLRTELVSMRVWEIYVLWILKKRGKVCGKLCQNQDEGLRTWLNVFVLESTSHWSEHAWAHVHRQSTYIHSSSPLQLSPVFQSKC